MIISIDNFKSIEHVVDIDLSNLTVLAGVNSSGKSSLIQALLMLKQTLNSSTSDIINLNGPYVYANTLNDLIHNKRGGAIGFSLQLSSTEIGNADLGVLTDDAIQPKYLKISVSFKVNSGSADPIVNDFSVITGFHEGKSKEIHLSLRPRKKKYDLSTPEGTFKDLTLDNYSFANFFPVFFKYNDRTFDLPEVKFAREILVRALENVTYIAPLRVAPVLARTYQTDVETRFVMPDGENTRFILDKMKDDAEAMSLVKEWICSKFRLAEDLSVVKESGKRYRMVVTTNDGLKLDLMHVGFGVSQILPIITQGCISRPGSLLIVEDPDVHMHPGIQAAMADFFIFLCKSRSVASLIETHSDHFVTRLRRRIAENEIPYDKVQLLFVENEFGSSEYRTIRLSPNGRPEGFMPPGFMDSLDSDFRAIIEANRK